MRILRIQLNGQLRPTHPGIKLENKDVRQQFRKEMDALLTELTEAIRERIASYLPKDYSVFVRFLLAEKTDSAKVFVWVDDPLAGRPPIAARMEVVRAGPLARHQRELRRASPGDRP
jgi:hypothetical protein